jgi:aspartyl-tRNA(Asn)/glutamyl-tRNA(Gln) amidotransferase subunit A
LESNSMTDLAQLALRSASEIGLALARRDCSPVILAEYLLDRIEASIDDHIFLCVTRERAIAEAKASEKRLAAGQALSPLDGVPIAWKDLFDMAGEVTTAGSMIYRDAPPANKDAAVVANATAAGMVALGKTNLNEFAYSGLGLNPHYGTPKNPHGHDRAPGGSSSGSAVAVARGLVPCAIGTDTGGSVRIPAGFNGLVGYKPSDGRIGKNGVFPLSRTLDTIGPLARTVEDCIALDRGMRGVAPTKVQPQIVEGLKLIVPETIVLDGLEPDVTKNFEASLTQLASAGASILRQSLPTFDNVYREIAEHGAISAYESFADSRNW